MSFIVDEVVSLTLEIKNINLLQIDIFEINTFNYCKENKQNFKDD